MQYIFRGNFGYNHVEVGRRFLSAVDFKKLMRLNKNIQSIGGHSLRTGLRFESVTPDIKYITFLRNPVDRFISHYNHGIRAKRHNMSLEDRAEINGEGNYQTKFIIGAQNLQERGKPIREKDLEKAKEILTKEYSFVGLVEQFDESLILMKKQLGVNHFDLRYTRENVTKKKFIQKKDLSKPMLDKLSEINILDIELYNYVKNELFEKIKANYSECFDGDLQRLRESNQHFSFNKFQLLKNRFGKYIVYRNFFKKMKFHS